MNSKNAISLVAAIFIFTSAGLALAETSSDPQAEDHSAHHADSNVPTKDGMGKGEMMESGMMGKMDMSQMSGMMEQCKAMHKDGKTCNHEMMESCQKDMSKADCMKMMSNTKKQKKTAKKN